jgi:hypothetical protein
LEILRKHKGEKTNPFWNEVLAATGQKRSTIYGYLKQAEERFNSNSTATTDTDAAQTQPAQPYRSLDSVKSYSADAKKRGPKPDKINPEN